MARAGYEADRNRLLVLHRASGTRHDPIRAEVDQSVASFVLAPPPPGLPAGSPAPTTVYLSTPRNGRHMVFVMRLDKCAPLHARLHWHHFSVDMILGIFD